MSQIVRMQGNFFHVPSIARTRIVSSSFIGRPMIKIVTHSGEEKLLTYKVSEWHLATRDFKKLESSRSVCFDALKKVPLLEDSDSENPLIESERPMR